MSLKFGDVVFVDLEVRQFGGWFLESFRDGLVFVVQPLPDVLRVHTVLESDVQFGVDPAGYVRCQDVGFLRRFWSQYRERYVSQVTPVIDDLLPLLDPAAGPADGRDVRAGSGTAH